MTTEEKARAYDEALDRAKERYNNMPLYDLEYVFPELKEGEDEKNERIRLGLIEVLKTVPSGIFEDRGGITLDEGFYWLERKEYEKQGEQKPDKWSEEDEKTMNWVIEDMRNTISSGIMSKGYVNSARKAIDWLKSLKERLQ